MSRTRVVALVVASAIALAGLGYGVYVLQSRNRNAALREYVSRVGPTSRSLYKSWTTFQRSIDRPEGSDELAVKASFDAATKLRDLLEKTKPPPQARLFHHEMTDVVRNVLTVIDARIRLAITGPQPDESGVIRDPQEQKRKLQFEAGNAFYVVRQTFPDAMTQLRALESASR